MESEKRFREDEKQQETKKKKTFLRNAIIRMSIRYLTGIATYYMSCSPLVLSKMIIFFKVNWWPNEVSGDRLHILEMFKSFEKIDGKRWKRRKKVEKDEKDEKYEEDEYIPS